MPRVERYDSDGEGIYEPPTRDDGPEWNLDGEPGEMGIKALCAAVARDMLGCQIKWWGYYCDWCCSCKGNPHGCDSQCSALATPDRLFERVIKACNAHGIALLAEPPEKLLRTALSTWRRAGPEPA